MSFPVRSSWAYPPRAAGVAKPRRGSLRHQPRFHFKLLCTSAQENGFYLSTQSKYRNSVNLLCFLLINSINSILCPLVFFRLASDFRWRRRWEEAFFRRSSGAVWIIGRRRRLANEGRADKVEGRHGRGLDRLLGGHGDSRKQHKTNETPHAGMLLDPFDHGRCGPVPDFRRRQFYHSRWLFTNLSPARNPHLPICI